MPSINYVLVIVTVRHSSHMRPAFRKLRLKILFAHSKTASKCKGQE